jgi:tetratricopeptide (TPR) repeat protein
LSERYGFVVVPEENQLNGLGYQCLFQEDIENAVEVFTYNTTLYPDSANVWDSLGEAYETAGKLKEAYESYSKAVKNAEKNADGRLGIFTTNRDRAKSELEGAKE